MNGFQTVGLTDAGVVEDFGESISRNPVLGLADVADGVIVLYPTTVYEVTNDDTSGIAGLLLPSGQFIPKAPRHREARYWEFSETDRYVRDATTGRVSGDSWRRSHLAWSGQAGAIRHNVTMKTDVYVEVSQNAKLNAKGEQTNLPRVFATREEEVTVHIRDKHEASLTGDWITTGEMERAMTRGTSMASVGPQMGRVHAE